MPLSDKETEFPVGFAETFQGENEEGDPVYAEWLENKDEFPELGDNHSHWEIVNKKEADKEDLTVVQERDDWSKINAFDMHSYVEIAEKNADVLKPTKKAVQPLWPDKSKIKEDQRKFDDKDNNSNDAIDAETLYETHKSQGKLAIRSSHLSQIRDLKTFDTMYPGIYDSGTSKTNEPIANATQEQGADVYHSFNSKSNALRALSTTRPGRYKYTRPDTLAKSNNKVDYSEYTVLDNNRKRYEIKKE